MLTQETTKNGTTAKWRRKSLAELGDGLLDILPKGSVGGVLEAAGGLGEQLLLLGVVEAELGDDGAGLVGAALGLEPARAGRDEGAQGGVGEGQERLDGDGQAPADGPGQGGRAVGHEEAGDQARGDAELRHGRDEAALPRRRDLAHVHVHGRQEDALARALDQPADDEHGQHGRGRLDGGADAEDGRADGDHAGPAVAVGQYAGDEGCKGARQQDGRYDDSVQRRGK